MAVRGGERARSAADGALVQVAVDGGAGHGEDVGDLLDGVLATVVELLGEGGLLGCELAAAAVAAARRNSLELLDHLPQVAVRD